MLKSLLIGAGLVLGAGLHLGLAGCASTGSPAAQRPSIPSGLPLGCVPDPKTQRCSSQFGTYYSGDDLRKTGAQHVGHALDMVDPEVTLVH